jgi:methylphosphotriester-DNA--protein-cysteine methyltransferase
MIEHSDLLAKGYSGKRQLAILVKAHAIQFAGNRKLKIYGTLSCRSGKRMKAINRIFFANEAEAIDNGYRPCGHCLRRQYLNWKQIK